MGVPAGSNSMSRLTERPGGRIRLWIDVHVCYLCSNSPKASLILIPRALHFAKCSPVKVDTKSERNDASLSWRSDRYDVKGEKLSYLCEEMICLIASP